MAVRSSAEEGGTLVGALRAGTVRDRRSVVLGTIAAAALVLLAAALRVYRLDWQSVWLDEIFSLTVADPSRRLDEFWGWVLADVHPPLYYLLLRIWSAVFGQSEAPARAFSVLFGVLTVAAAGIVFRSVLPLVGRLALMILLAISPAAIQYSQEVRSYALLIFLSTVLTGLCARHLRASSAREANRLAAALTLVAVLASFTHYFGFLLAAAALFACLAGSRNRKQAFGVVAGSVVLVATFLPWVAYHAHFIGPQAAAWIGQMPVGVSIDWFLRLSFGGWLAFAVFIGSVAVGLLSSGEFRRLIGDDPVVKVALALCSLTFVAALAISLHTPILTTRNMVVILPAIYLLVADLVAHAFSQRGALFAAGLLLGQAALIAWPLPTYYTYMSKAQWRESAAFVLKQPGCEAAAIYVYVYSEGDAFYYRYFTKKVRPAMRLIEIPYGGSADLSREQGSPCRVLVWAANYWRVELDELLPKLSVKMQNLDVVEFNKAFVVLKK
jgi:uncharacterized membrane protein